MEAHMKNIRMIRGKGVVTSKYVRETLISIQPFFDNKEFIPFIINEVGMEKLVDWVVEMALFRLADRDLTIDDEFMGAMVRSIRAYVIKNGVSEETYKKDLFNTKLEIIAETWLGRAVNQLVADTENCDRTALVVSELKRRDTRGKYYWVWVRLMGKLFVLERINEDG
jgi:hypothetical protein